MKGYDVMGLDISKGLISVAKEAYPEIPFVEGSFLDLPFADNTFDGVWAHASLVHLSTDKDARGAIREFSRVLKQNGIIYLYVKEQIGDKKTAFKTDGFSDKPRFFRYYTKKEMGDMLKDAGFSVIKNEEQNDLGKREGVNWILSLGRKN